MKHTLVLCALALLLLPGCSQRAADGEWIDLFNGEDLSGWKANEHPESFWVEDGLLVCSGERGHLFYEGSGNGVFKNFELVADLLAEPQANSGIFFHTAPQPEGWLKRGYEVQVNNTHVGANNYRETKKTGSLYGIRNVYYPMAKDNEWFQMRIKVVENRVQIFVNDKQVVDYIQPDSPWRSSEQMAWLVGEGQFALQAHDPKSTVRFQSIKVRRLPDGEKTPLQVEESWDTTITQLMQQGIPFVDYHVHLKGGLTTEQALANSLKLGINYGIAPNCGLRFPVTDDASLYQYMDTVVGQPIFRGMQAEGREWITLFSPEAVSTFDYVFTDAMTFTDKKGRRNRTWIAEEVFVDDKEEFMETLVGKIEAIFSQEPVEIYVNPTVLPDVLKPEADKLWTKERRARVVKVLAENNIVLEINARYKTPSAEMIKEAKAAGIKFMFGTNNNTAELGRLEYCLDMIKECGLTADDIFMPKPNAEKPVNTKGFPAKITG